MNKAAEMYYLLNDALTALGRANAVYADTSRSKWSHGEDEAMNENLAKARRVLTNAQNLLCKHLEIKVPEK